MRLNRYLAACGLGSRRNVEELIKSGQIKVNGITIKDFIEIDPVRDEVLYNDKNLKQEEKYYIAFYKPPFVISSVSDKQNRCIGDFFKEFGMRLFPIGRLDYLSEGLIFVTNDGLFANLIAHPSSKIKKTYLVKLQKPLSENMLEILSKGVRLDDGFFKPITVSLTDNKFWIKIMMDSGRNRIIRRYLKKLDIGVQILKRIAIGGVKLGYLQPGGYRFLEKNEILQLTHGRL